MKCVVTGAAGFIGSHLCENLQKSGYEVLGIDALTPHYSPELKKLNAAQVQEQGVKIVQADLVVDDLTTLLDGASYIFHLAALPGLSSTTPLDLYLRNNVAATAKLLEATRKLPALKGFINVATSSVYGADATSPETAEPKPTSWYGVTKLAAEQLVLAAQRSGQLPACSLRLFSVYGPRERPDKMYPRLIRAALLGESFSLFEGSEHHRRSFTYVGDIVEGFRSVLSQEKFPNGEIFNIGTDEQRTTGEAIQLVEEIVGKKIHINRVAKRSGDQLSTHAQIEKARTLLGYAPSTRFIDGLRVMVEWFQENMEILKRFPG